MTFEKGNSYKLDFDRVEQVNGKLFFALKHEDKTTLPGCEPFYFRVEALDYQKNWDPDDIPEQFPCFVSGFIKDYDGQETAFPILKQDLNAILSEFYEIGKPYLFTVSALPEGRDFKGQPIEYHLLSDVHGLEHRYFSDREHGIGDELELTVSAVKGHWLEFISLTARELQKSFISGQRYSFEIVAEELDRLANRSFFAVKDKIHGYMHRFYLSHASDLGPGDEIELLVKEVSPKGWLILMPPGSEFNAGELAALREISQESPGRENGQLELKSSLVFTAKSEQDIDKQLGNELMQQIAAFMNANGGCIYIGYRDNGTICGINNDLPLLNSSLEDEYSYKTNLDGVELKIRNTVARKLGGFANSLLDIQFQKTGDGKVVCLVIVPPSSKPIYLEKTAIYKRSGNMCQQLKGDEITFFIIDRMKRDLPKIDLDPDNMTLKVEKTEKITEKDKEEVKVLPEPDASTHSEAAPWCCFTFYRTGEISRQKDPVNGGDVLANIRLTANDKNKRARLLLCYDNGRINIVNPCEVYKEKLARSGKKYSNGWNAKAKLIKILRCSESDFLVIHSVKPDGTAMAKAVAIANYAVHNPLSMQTQGNEFVKLELAKVVNLECVPAESGSYINRIFIRSKNGHPGYSVQSNDCRNAMSFLKKLHRRIETDSDARD